MRRLRPLRLARLAGELRDVNRTAKGLGLIREYFPDRLGEFDPSDGWYSILSSFLHMVEEAGWFEIDWQHLDYIWEVMKNYDGEDEEYESDPEYDLAAALEVIPVRFYNWSEEQWWNEVPENYGWLALLAGMFTDKIQLNAEQLIDLEIYDALGEFTAVELAERLQTTDWSTFEEPLCWLPEMVGLCVGFTGNALLDGYREMYEPPTDYFRWDGDVERLRELWQQARPAVEHFRKFHDWAEGEPPERMQQMVAALTGWEEAEAEEDDELWLDQAAGVQNERAGSLAG